MVECNGKNCVGIDKCPFHRIDALKKRNQERFEELEAVLAQTDELTIKLEKIDIKSASRKKQSMSKKAVKKP